LEEIARAESENDLDEIRKELALTGYVKLRKTARKETSAPGAPLRFISSAGLPILAGRNYLQNETLTHRLASKTDVWLHAQKIPGAHVVVPSSGGMPDDADAV
jgi:predicted ribosome quality control (RQC) complex YloA/Tae2 family protein